MLHNRPPPSSSTTSMSIDAGRAVGPFFIGMDIGTALVIASQYEENPDVIVDRENPFTHDTRLDLPNLGFRLCFDGYYQRLHVIVVHLQSAPCTLGTPKPAAVEGQESSSPRTTTSLLRSVLSFSVKNVPLIRSARYPPDLRHIYRVCGPTIPGHYQLEESIHETIDAPSLCHPPSPVDSTLPSDSPSESPPKPSIVYYYLKYPGLAFRFPIPYEDYAFLKISEEDLLPFCLPVSAAQGFTAPIVDRLFLFPSDSPLTDALNPPWLSPSPISQTILATSSSVTSGEKTAPSNLSGLPSFSSVLAPEDLLNPEEPTPPASPPEEPAVPLSLIPKQRHWNIVVILREGIRFPYHGGSIHFGASLQDVYAEVGAPDQVTLKDIDVVGIMATHTDLTPYLDSSTYEDTTSQRLGLTSHHASIKHHPQAISSPDYFCNYFLRGFDLLICGTTHRVMKIILHTNIPGHLQFGDYSRCFFSIPLKGPSLAAIDVDSRWEDIEKYLGQSAPPILVDTSSSRQSGEATTGGLTTVRKFYGYPGIAIEVFDKKWIASVSLF